MHSSHSALLPITPKVCLPRLTIFNSEHPCQVCSVPLSLSQYCL